MSWFRFSFMILFCIFIVCAQALFGANILRVAVSQNVGNMNPQGYNTNQIYAQNMIYEGLVKTDKKGNIIPSLATSWEIKDSGKTYIFHLRKNVIFSNGEAFHAKAVVKNFESILKNREKHSWSALAMAIDSVRMLDDFTIILTLKKPYIATLHELSLPRPFRFIAPSVIPNDLDLVAHNPKPIGTGPYMLTETKVGISDTFSKNPYYWDKEHYHGIYYDTIITKVIIDSHAKLIALKTKQVDMVYGADMIPLEIFHSLAKEGQFQTLLSPPLFTTFLLLNPNHAPLNHKAMRKAIAHSIEKEKIMKSIYYGYQKSASYLFQESLPYTQPKSYKAPNYDLQQAQKILKKLGYAKQDDGFLYKNGEKLSLQLHFIANNSTHKAVATIMQAQLKEIGIFLQLIPHEASIYYKKQMQGEFALCFSQTWGVPYEPFTFINSMRHSGHADYVAQKGLPEKVNIDTAIQEIMELPYDTSLKQEDKENILHAKTAQFLDMLYQTEIYIPLTYNVNTIVTKKGIQGIMPDMHAFEIPFWEFYEE